MVQILLIQLYVGQAQAFTQRNWPPHASSGAQQHGCIHVANTAKSRAMQHAVHEYSFLLFAHPNQRRVARQVLRLVYHDVQRAPHPLRRILLLLLLQRTQQ